MEHNGVGNSPSQPIPSTCTCALDCTHKHVHCKDTKKINRGHDTLSSPPTRYAQVFGTIQAYSHWLSQLYLSALRQPQQPQLHDLVVSLVTTIADSAIPLISHEVPERIVLSSCQLLLSVVNTVRPKFFLSLPSVQKLMEKATSEAIEQLPLKVMAIECFPVFSVHVRKIGEVW